MKFNLEPRENFTLVSFELDGAVTPDILVGLRPPTVPPEKGVVISGRGPIWLHSYLAHYYHFCKWVGHHDPRLGGAVVSQSHDPQVREGEVIPV